jgi:hypothetical protein
MNDQLVLLDEDDEGRKQYRRLDDHTRDVGRKGVALAREALRQAAVRAADGRQAA